MYISATSMFLVSVLYGYLLGIAEGWGLKGIYWCMIADETIRGILVLRRWRERKILRRREAGCGGSASSPELPASL